ncbi:MAG: nucleotidyltransferase domain-containing protein [archaeon]
MQLIECVLGKKNNIKILRYLIKHRDWEFNITELSKDIEVNKGILSRIVKDLEKNNIIRVNRKGRILLFKINKENLIIRKIIIPLFESEEIFFDLNIKNRILKIKDKNIISIILYGSYAREDFKIVSDMDLMVVVKKRSTIIKKIEDLKKEFFDDDLILNVDIVRLTELKNLYKRREPLITSIEKNHKTIYGKKFKEMI